MTGHAEDPDRRRIASSGGALTALLVYALEARLVDRVVHVAASPDDPVAACVTCSRSAQAILAGAGSRYVASSPLAAIDRILAEGGTIAFVGKPCDVSALRALAAHDPRVDRHVRYALSFFCAGIPSRRAIRRMLAAMNVPEQELAALRYRGHGWPGNAVAQTKSGLVAEMSYEHSWGGFLSRDVQFRCKICPDAVGGAADIACGDAWHSDEKGYPMLMEQGDGRSLVIARTQAGQRLVGDAVAAGLLSVHPLDVGQIHAMQPAQARRKRLVGARMAGLRATFQPHPRAAHLGVREAAATASLGSKLKDFLGSVRRVLTGQR
jgi:coenzyme F420 hydrogenase subunit beta